MNTHRIDCPDGELVSNFQKDNDGLVVALGRKSEVPEFTMFSIYKDTREYPRPEKLKKLIGKVNRVWREMGGR